MPSSFRALAAVTVAAAIGMPAPVAARGGSAEEDPRELFTEGVRLYGSGYYLEALDRFTRSYRATPRPKVLLNIGQTELKLGREPAAAQSFRRFLERAPHDVDSNRPELLRFANDNLATLTPHLARLVWAVTPAEAQRSVDGEPADPSEAELYVAPGDHAIVATAAGHQVATTRVTCAAGQTCPVEMTLAPTAAADAGVAPSPVAVAPEAVAPPPPPPRADLTSVSPRPSSVAELGVAAPVSHTPALVVAGVGAVVGVAAIVATVLTGVEYGALPVEHASVPASSAGYSGPERTELTTARVADGLWVGAALVEAAAGIVWLATGPPAPASPKPSG